MRLARIALYEKREGMFLLSDVLSDWNIHKKYVQMSIHDWLESIGLRVGQGGVLNSKLFFHHLASLLELSVNNTI